ncbi:MAG: hypothetical protein AAF711_13730 [Planctomycetota bacterium]
MIISADTHDEIALQLCSRVTYDAKESTYARSLADQFVKLYAEETSDTGTYGALVGKYAIRRDDVQLFETASSVIVKTAGAGFFLGAEPALSGIVAIGVAVLTMLRRLWVRGVLLDNDKVAVLSILLANQESGHKYGLTAQQLLDILNREQLIYKLNWLENVLNELSAEPTPDGDSAELASSDELGRWRCHA